MDQTLAYREELTRLRETQEEIARQLAGIGARYYGHDLVEQALDAKRQEKKQRLELLQKEPYFGRLDFQEDGTAAPVPLYIGKRGLNRADTDDPWIIDWRAPVASLFYSFTGGDEPVTYEAPDGPVQGVVHLKRNLAIRDGTLQRVVDSYVRGEDNLGVSDEFLLYRLGENKDNRLRDIVATIQAEQDRIIRAPGDAALLIQGAAGSGKTTVALHRLAYLLYRYRERMRAERMIIFAPNPMFLDYISGVLPELGVGDIRQTTFADWALEQLQHRVALKDDRVERERRFSVGARPAADGRVTGTDGEMATGETATGDATAMSGVTAGRWKGSLAFKELLEEALAAFERDYLPDEDFTPWDGALLPAETIRSWFETEYGHEPLARRKERLAARIRRWMEMELQTCGDAALRKTNGQTGKRRLQAFLNKLPQTDALSFYKLLFGVVKPPARMRWRWDEVASTPFAAATRTDLQNGFVAYEDLAPLVWIHHRLHGGPDRTFDHVVIDEAQDVSPFQVALLRAYMREPSFTILGDLAQGIHDDRGILRWEELAAVFPPSSAIRHDLTLSYRSTMEIIAFANRILPHTGTGLPPAQPVFRSGEDVKVIRVTDARERLRLIRSFAEECVRQGMLSVALIGRTTDDCRELWRSLAEDGLEAALIEEGQSEYRGGLSVIPAHLSKGLEFDAVLLADADATRYPATPLNAKLLYVGCTRALHRLYVLYNGRLSPLLEREDSHAKPQR